MIRVALRSVGSLQKRCLSQKTASIQQNTEKSVTTKQMRKDVTLSIELFDDLKAKVHGSGRSIDKILITVKDEQGSSKEFLMNRHVSTPNTCAKHISRSLVNSSGLAIATYTSGATQFISMNTRFDQPCEVEYVNFNNPDKAKADAVNQAFWRSASVATAAALSDAFQKPSLPIFKSVNDGVFAAEAKVNWEGTLEDLKELEKRVHSYISSNEVFDILLVPESVAVEYGFQNSVQICKIGNYVCLVDGPTIRCASQFGRFKLLKSSIRGGSTVVGGVSLPSGQSTNSFSWDLICKNALSRFSL